MAVSNISAKAKRVTRTGNTDNLGLVSLGVTVDRLTVLSIYMNDSGKNYILIPMCFSNVWHAKVLTYSGDVVKNQSVSFIYYYI